MGYKVPTDTLLDTIKLIETNNKFLATIKSTPAIVKLINANKKQIAIIKDAAPFDLDLYAVEKK